LLSMTATPIPRTLALGLYGDLSISVIDQLPEGRQEILTKAVRPEDRQKAYEFIRSQIKEGRQAFVICPLIDPSKKKTEESVEAELENLEQTALFEVEKRSAVQEFEKLSKQIFPELNIGLLHGKMKNKDKEEVMNQFAAGDLHILVSTAVVEVGIDVQNATVMMIEGAERFGLAQLHQFRGRVGRGEYKSYCFLFADSWGETTKARLQALVESNNGFELAEKDLQLRGPGELVGLKQSGLPDLKMASLTDTILVSRARNSAEKIVEKNIASYPLLQQKLTEFEKTRHLE
jgi:ATP-dependent DNA helicase RecG